MLIFAAKRIAHGLVMLLSVSLLAYFLLFIGSGNVAQLILGLQATPEQIALKNEELGLNRPFFEQFITWLQGAITLNFGQSWSMAETVNEVLFPRLGVTLTIVALTTIVAALVSIILGTAAALFGGWIDRVVQFFGLLGFAVPGFLVAFLLVTLFAIQIPIFNAVG